MSENSANLPAPVRAEAAKTEPDMNGVWRCEECGVSQSLDPRWRWTGERWEHHHGYPVGHVSARYFGPLSASPVREAEPKLCQAAQYRPGGVFMFNTTTRAMENCENELFVKASELDKAEAQWIRIAAEDVRDAKLAGLREAEPLKALIETLRAKELARLRSTGVNADYSVSARHANAYLKALADVSAALEGANNGK